MLCGCYNKVYYKTYLDASKAWDLSKVEIKEVRKANDPHFGWYEVKYEPY
jgi:hypothetical protein